MTEAYAAEWIDFEKDLGYRPVLDGDIGTILKQWESLGKDLVSKFPMKGFDTSVQRDDRIVTQSGNRVRIYTSPSVKNSNLCIYIHGGGWAMGDIDSEDAQCVEFCKRSKMIVVSIEYRLSPEHKFPIPLDDCVELYDWAVAHASTFDCLAERIVLAGGSAGANLALAVALRLIDEGHHRSPDGLFLAVPVTVDPRLIPKELEGRHTSYVDNADTGPNSPGGMIGFAGEITSIGMKLLTHVDIT
ncbi:hypothetical protein H2204_007851 [Knufia peltigerae]|uniref:Alpha/beta hydrolase fold-3 domain-containing protein n=1 Tax=Knufia peltigerae TaxID=1002370 RepID=A0AA39CXG9_9EURO|nr:hypothetical protein H2204_007851 [Knufia peltigerae]